MLLLALLGGANSCSESKKPPPSPPVPVMVATVEQKTVPVEIRNIGNVEAYATVNIKSRVGGQLIQANFKEGDYVEKGQLLFVIDPRPYEAALRQAEANLAKDQALYNKAQADLRRYTELIRKQFVSQQEYDQAKATAESLGGTIQADQVAVQNAKLNLSYCYIHAPISGRTGNLLANEGNMIKADADTAMLVINQIQPIYVSFTLPEKNLPVLKKYLAKGKVPVEAVIPSDPEHPETGVLTFVNNTVDQATGTVQCKATFANPGRHLWPGLFVNVIVNLATEPDTIVIPSQALQTSQTGQFVWLVSPNMTAETRQVEVGRSLDGEVIITKGLQQGEKVVTDGQLRLSPGAKVQVKNQP